MNSTIFRENAIDFEEQEILSHILQYSSARGDKEELAFNLLESFGRLKTVIEARPEQLASVKGMTKKTADFIASFLPMFRVYNKCMNNQPNYINSAMQAANYCLSLLEGCRNEKVYLICTNAQNQIIGKRLISEGSLSEVCSYPRMIVETALNYNAHSVIMAHNHPGGTCAPSMEDIKSTQLIQGILNKIGIRLLDHIIVANNNTYSMIEHGDITYRVRD